MEICYVYDAIWPWETGGVQKRVWELARRLADAHDVHWYGLRYWDGPPIIEREGVTLHGVMSPPEFYVDGRRSISEALAFSARLARPLLRRDFDIIDCQEFPYFPAFPSKFQALMRDTTLLLTWHEVWGDYWYEYLGWKGVFGKTIERLVARLPDTHVAVSQRTQQKLVGLGGPESTLVPNGVSMAEIDAVPTADERIDVLFIGRLIPEKNPGLVVRTVAALRDTQSDVRGVLVGEGPERSQLEGLVADLELEQNVVLMEFRESYEEVLSLLKAADVFVLPSRREGFGMTALEALACGTPVVTIAHPQNAVQELVTDRTGIVCTPDPNALARAVRTAGRDVSAADCIAVARQYEWDQIAEQVETVYTEALDG